MLLPCEDNLLRSITINRPAIRVGRYDNLPCDIERALFEVISQEIAFQKQLERLKLNLEAKMDFSPLAAYKAVDKFNDGYITTQNLGSFLRACGHHSNKIDCLQIIRRVD